ncbi:hypothetical protein RRG08_053203 [Elysia crispata]|uniref:Uncharacterized protein n=1 Tax=Elysia crispata TaxID=231223 RepID=A0AAE1E9Q3_9GAST|nr:hypothetical protein RRG08_053203 [Elysia crispata]
MYSYIDPYCLVDISRSVSRTLRQCCDIENLRVGDQFKRSAFGYITRNMFNDVISQRQHEGTPHPRAALILIVVR